MTEEEQMQQNIQKYQELQQQIEQVQNYIDQVEDNVEELGETITAVRDLEDQEEGSEILVPIGSGAFVVGELKENSKVVTNIGGDAFEKQGVEDAEEILEERKNQLEETREELGSTVQQLQQEMQQIQGKLQKAREGAAGE